MAFNFLGTFNSDQLQDLRSFLDEQVVDINEEINYLYVEMNKISQTLNEFIAADTNFGGDTVNSISQTALPIITDSIKQDDSYPARLMAQVKAPFITTIKYKRERNEFKIKKLLDAWEQTKETIDRKAIAKSQTTALMNQIESLIISSNSNILTNT